MNFEQLVLVVVTLSITIVTSECSFLEEDSHKSLLRFMSHSNNLLKRNPSLSYDCFNYYIPLIDDLTQKYQRNYNNCVVASYHGHEQAETATLDKRNDLISRSNNSCQLLGKCQNVKSAVEVFECFVQGGSENAVAMYNINRDAAENLADLQEQFRLITITEYKCTNETKRAYEEESAQAYHDFNNCILGIGGVPTTPASTVQTKPTETPEVPIETKPTETTGVPTETAPTETTESPVETNDRLSPELRLSEEDISPRSMRKPRLSN